MPKNRVDSRPWTADHISLLLPQPLDHCCQPNDQIGIDDWTAMWVPRQISSAPKLSGRLQARLPWWDQIGEFRHLDRCGSLGILGDAACAQGLGECWPAMSLDELVHKDFQIGIVEP